MKSLPSEDEVREDLGDKVMEGFSYAVDHTRADLAEYRGIRPDWVSQHSERGLANWLHDRLWQHLIVALDPLPEVHVTDGGVTRELTVGHRYRLRAKRHDEAGMVQTYPTQTALAFMLQRPEEPTFEGFEEVRLLVGYAWDRETRNVGAGLLSLRADREKIIWQIELPPSQSGGIAPPVGTPLPPTQPQAPEIQVGEGDEEQNSGAGSA
ncbi:hypothetical protein [Prauserella marina]|nr:hypothetical protein [Prauserella marina]